jgi:hypothetical protein
VEVAFAQHKAVIENKVKLVSEFQQQTPRMSGVIWLQSQRQRRSVLIATSRLYVERNHLQKDVVL